MRFWNLMLVGGAVLAAPFSAICGPRTYFCVVEQVKNLTDNGQMSDFGLYMGNKFAVNRDTGEVIGGPFDNLIGRTYKVLHRGGTEHSFRVLITAPPPVNWINYLNVNESVTGDKKPFMGFDGGGMVFSGRCE